MQTSALKLSIPQLLHLRWYFWTRLKFKNSEHLEHSDSSLFWIFFMDIHFITWIHFCKNIGQNLEEEKTEL